MTSHERPKDKWPKTQIIELHLAEPEHRALFYKMRRFGKGSNIAVVAQWLLLLALAHPAEMDRLGDQIVRYAKLEGLTQFNHMRSRIAQTKGGRLGKLACVK